MADTQELRTMLDELIRANFASQSAYAQAADATDNAHYASIFRQLAAERDEFARELNAILAQVGGTPVSEDSIGGALHDLWVNLKASLTAVDATFVAECDRTEEATVHAYQAAVSEAMPAAVDQLLRRQLGILKGGHERIHRLNGALHQQPEAE